MRQSLKGEMGMTLMLPNVSVSKQGSMYGGASAFDKSFRSP
jgi:hypothetical protein